MKLQLVYEEPYAGYPDAEVVKSPSPVPRTVRGGVDLSVFNSGTGSIKARTGARTRVPFPLNPALQGMLSCRA